MIAEYAQGIEMWKHSRSILPVCPNCSSDNYNGLPRILEDSNEIKDRITMRYYCYDCDQVYNITYVAVEIEAIEELDDIPF